MLNTSSNEAGIPACTPVVSDACDDVITPRVLSALSSHRTRGSDIDTQACKIMIVDDEQFNIMVFRRYLRDAGYRNIIHTTDPAAAMDLLARERPDVLLLDIVMPGVNGLEILAQMSTDASWDHLPVLILTASREDTIKKTALDLGATDFLNKPVTANDLIPRVRNSLLNKVYKDRLTNHANELELLVRQRTEELAWSRREVVFCLARAGEFRDSNTGHHVVRVGRYVGVIARQLGFPPAQIEVLELAAQLHDIGKIGIPDQILNKPDKLTAEEYATIKRHCSMGLKIIEPHEPSSPRAEIKAIWQCRSPLLVLAAKITASHHEKWDGGGYPSGLKGEEIPIEARMTAVADVFDALNTPRPYKAAFSLEKCLQILEEGRGTHFDPRVLDAFLAGLEDVLAIRNELKDEEPPVDPPAKPD